MDYIIFDLEATCWEGNPLGRIQEIIEIGAVHIDAYGTVGESYQKFVRPIHDPVLSLYCRQLTGITQDDVQSARPFSSVGQDFMHWIQDRTTDACQLCSWGDKDHELLLRACREASLESDWIEPYVDLKAEYHRIQGIQQKIGLKKTLIREGFEFDGDHHRALDDAQNLVKLFLRHFDMWMR